MPTKSESQLIREWKDFLILRRKGIPFSEKDLTKLITVAKREGLSRDETDKKIAEVLGIGIQTLRKKARLSQKAS
ncbi:MAG: hypothetical protein HY805_03100 [Nitrospirae bacterium]|nr:hypothetical protein [Nitrospirota bacterium]